MNENPWAQDGPVAWDTPGTRIVLVRWVASQIAKMVCWFALWWGVLAFTVIVLPAGLGSAIPMGLLLITIGYKFVVAFAKLLRTRLLWRILITYPWRQQPGGVQVINGKIARFVLPDPDHPEKTVSPEEPPQVFSRWDRLARKGFTEDLWYAGDPRFICVVVRPGLKTLGFVRDPVAWRPRNTTPPEGASLEARRRAWSIGARWVEPVSTE